MLNRDLGDMLNKENGKYSMKVIYMFSMELCKNTYLFIVLSLGTDFSESIACLILKTISA